jgi:prepilin-type N-terminal cleavage/methylation domain-containing protein/prepilin-type processing-associated H-X9-DG protein
MRGTRTSRRRGFTLVELLVVIGIIALLVSILLPVLSNARKTANDTQCASNMRQLCTALVMYANEFKGKFPPNIGSSGPAVQWWYDAERIGRYLPKTKQFATTSVYGTVFICPRDEEAGRSYAMNYYASSGPLSAQYAKLPWAAYFGSASKPASKLILMAEKFSVFGPPGSYAAGNTVGLSNTPGPPFTPGSVPNNPGCYPGKRFVGDPNPAVFVATGGRFGNTPTEIDWSRHRRRGEGRTYQDYDGRANFGFADGHVASFRSKELGDRASGRSTFEALWSPTDLEYQRALNIP